MQYPTTLKGCIFSWGTPLPTEDTEAGFNATTEEFAP